MSELNHGNSRVRERMGIPKKAVARMVEKAATEGRSPNEFSGRFRRYLDGLFLKHHKATNIRVYGQYIFLFNTTMELITAWPFPAGFKNKHKLMASS